MELSDESPEKMRAFADAAVLKQGPACEHVLKLISHGEKIIVFAHHHTMLDGLEETAQVSNIQYIRIDGTTSSPKRHALITSFQDDPNVKLAILSIKACSTGLTLTAAKIAVFAELYWNPGTLLQAEDRIHRIGQMNDVEIHYLLACGSIDEAIWPLVLKKMNVLGSLGMGGAEFIHDQSEYGTRQAVIDEFKM